MRDEGRETKDENASIVLMSKTNGPLSEAVVLRHCIGSMI